MSSDDQKNDQGDEHKKAQSQLKMHEDKLDKRAEALRNNLKKRKPVKKK